MFFFEDPQPLLFWGTARTKNCKAADFGAVAANYDDDRGTKDFGFTFAKRSHVATRRLEVALTIKHRSRRGREEHGLVTR
jgi:hypothetical protein